jgi:HlyD family secretion protein
MRRARLAICVGALAACACAEDSPPMAVGTLERDRLDLVAEASEPVVARPFPEGSFVEAGALLVKLEPTRLEAQVAQASSARARAAARLAELVRGPRHERIAEARARLKGADGRLDTARSDLERISELLDGGVASQGQMDQQHAIFEESLAARDAASATLDALLDGTTAEELAQAEAAVAEADAVLADSRVRLARLEVRAPTAGWLDALPYEIGERPPAGGVVAVLLADRAPYGRVYVPAAIRVHVKPGTPARVRVEGIADPLPGRVRTVASEASFTPYFALTEHDRGRLVYLAKVDLTGPTARDLPTGVPVTVEFVLDGVVPGDVSHEASGDVARDE